MRQHLPRIADVGVRSVVRRLRAAALSGLEGQCAGLVETPTELARSESAAIEQDAA